MIYFTKLYYGEPTRVCMMTKRFSLAASKQRGLMAKNRIATDKLQNFVEKKADAKD